MRSFFACIVTVAIVFISAGDCLAKERYHMGGVGISSGWYGCGNGRDLNLDRWWTEPVAIPGHRDSYYLCGGNVPVEGEKGRGTDDCILVDVKGCSYRSLPSRMSTTRQALQPVCMTNGQCLLFGGNTSEAVGTAVSIDSINLTDGVVRGLNWGLPEPRLAYAAVALNDREILVTGGYGVKDPETGNGPVYNSAVILDVASGTGHTIFMRYKRGGHSITKLPNGTFLLIGGAGDDPAGGEIFDPKTHTFTPVESKMRFPRKDHRAVLAADGNVYIIGGSMGGESVKLVERFDSFTGEFTPTFMRLSEGREDAAVVYIKEFDVIAVVGGELKGRPGEPESRVIDVLDLRNRRVYTGRLKTPRDEPSLIIREVNPSRGTARLLVLTGQRKRGGAEVSLPVEEIVIRGLQNAP